MQYLGFHLIFRRVFFFFCGGGGRGVDGFGLVLVGFSLVFICLFCFRVSGDVGGGAGAA